MLALRQSPSEQAGSALRSPLRAGRERAQKPSPCSQAAKVSVCVQQRPRGSGINLRAQGSSAPHGCLQRCPGCCHPHSLGRSRALVPRPHGEASTGRLHGPVTTPYHSCLFLSGLHGPLLHRAESSLGRDEGSSPALSEIGGDGWAFSECTCHKHRQRVGFQTFIWRLLPWLIVGLSERGGGFVRWRICMLCVAM